MVYMVVKTLTKKYAQLRGEYDHAEMDAETAFGLEAIDAVTARILKRKKVIHEQLDAIEKVIHIYDPRWDFATVKPIRPHKSNNPKGGVAQLAYDVLRENDNEPMTIAQIVHGVIARLGIEDTDDKLRKRYRSAINGTFMNRRDDIVKMLEGLPRRWMLRDFVPLPPPGASSSTRAKTATARVPPQRAAAS